MTFCRFFGKNFVLLDIVYIQFRILMPTGKTVFSKLMDLVSDYELGKCIDKYQHVDRILETIGESPWHKKPWTKLWNM